MKALTFICLICLALGLATTCFAEAAIRSASIVELDGQAEVKRADEGWVPAEVGMALTQGDIVRTAADSMAVIYLEGDVETAHVELKEGGELKLAELIADPADGTQTTLLDLAIGEILITSKKLRSEKSKFEVKTPTSIVGVRGTTFSVAVEEE